MPSFTLPSHRVGWSRAADLHHSGNERGLLMWPHPAVWSGLPGTRLESTGPGNITPFPGLLPRLQVGTI